MSDKPPCPKCQYVRADKDIHVMKGICPACGIAIAKWKAQSINTEDSITAETIEGFYVQESVPLKQQLLAFFTYIPERIDPFNFWGRVFVFGLFVLWGCSFIISGVDWEEVGGSFLHSVNLPFHEFGHVLFSPLGRFMAILGGSLFQVLMPLIAMLSFSIQMRDNFAASIMLWWCGQNFIDVAPYIADAEYRAIPLILGLGEESHDWGNLLTILNKVEQAQAYANLSYYIGTAIILFSFYWGGYILLLQKKALDKEEVCS